ncbi:MAG: hypothetical protein U9R57_04045, partial [Thermodesulfobacteriota bacterium]|nr:hypothetical protein [Thermodesulfobacteriota bacterium]
RNFFVSDTLKSFAYSLYVTVFKVLLAEQRARKMFRLFNVRSLGSEFLNEVEAAIERILQFSEAWSNLSHRTRRCFTNRFPYGLIYQTQKNHIRIIAVAHSHRHPKYWVDRSES